MDIDCQGPAGISGNYQPPLQPMTRRRACVLHFEALTGMYVNGQLPFGKFRQMVAEMVQFIGTKRHQIDEPVPPEEWADLFE